MARAKAEKTIAAPGQPIFRVAHNGQGWEAVSGDDFKHAAMRYIKKHNCTGGFVQVRDDDNRERRFILRSRRP